MNEHADAVRHERLRRDWSVRTASAAGKISNTYWGEFEDYKRPLTPHIADAVARAFGWPADWAEDSFPEVDATRLDGLEVEVRRLARGVDRLADVLGVTLTDADVLPEPTDVDPPDAGGRQSSP